MENDMTAEVNINNENLFPEILAVTASRKGSDSVFKTADILRNKAKEMGVELKAEIQDDLDVIGHLTPEEIKQCKGIIVATDTSVVLKRFAGKQVLVTTISHACNEPEKLIRTILNNEAPVAEISKPETVRETYRADETAKDRSYEVFSSLNRVVPFLTGGAFMFVIALLLSTDPDSPIRLFFSAVGKTVFEMIVPILSAGIAYALGGKNALMIGFVGGALADKGYDLAWLADQDTVLCTSGIPGAILAGITAAYLGDAMERFSAKMPSSTDALRFNILNPIIGILVISMIMFSFNGFLSPLNQNIVNAIESAGISEQIMAVIILILMVMISLVKHKKHKE